MHVGLVVAAVVMEELSEEVVLSVVLTIVYGLDEVLSLEVVVLSALLVDDVVLPVVRLLVVMVSHGMTSSEAPKSL